MPDKKTLDRVRADKRAGKSAATQAGEFVREEIEHIREGKHGARSAKQAIAIGLSKARRAGVDLPPPKPGTTSEETRKRSTRDYAVGHGAAKRPPSPARSKASREALERGFCGWIASRALAAGKSSGEEKDCRRTERVREKGFADASGESEGIVTSNDPG